MFEAEITLNSEQVAQAVAEYVNKNTQQESVTASDIRFEVSGGYEDRPGMSVGPRFTGVKIKVSI